MNKLILLFAATLLAFTPSLLQAKRSAPKDVAPVKIGDIEYSAPHSRMACIEIHDTKADTIAWRQIYIVVVERSLEKDVQDCFINSLEVKDGALLIKNERGGEFKLDPTTLNVQVLKGALIINK